jgi:NAD(P)-dependent dehydrogenase (short-subunit alcohol dehydrogenase family)
MQGVVRHLVETERPGSIVNILSMAAHSGQSYLTPYAASKRAQASDGIYAEKEKVAPQLELFRSLGAACLAYGETAGTIQNKRNVPLNTRHRLPLMRSGPTAAA